MKLVNGTVAFSVSILLCFEQVIDALTDFISFFLFGFVIVCNEISFLF